MKQKQDVIQKPLIAFRVDTEDKKKFEQLCAENYRSYSVTLKLIIKWINNNGLDAIYPPKKISSKNI